VQSATAPTLSVQLR